MKRIIFSILIGASLLTSCGDKANAEFLITDTQVGVLKKGTKIGELETLFPEDSLVTESGEKPFVEAVEVYKTDGQRKLVATPDENGNSENPIAYVEILDENYKTKEGIGIKSLFKDFKKQYTVNNVSTSFGWVMVTFKDTPLYITIDKAELSEEVRYNLNAKVELPQIPDDAKIKLLMMAWDFDEEE